MKLNEYYESAFEKEDGRSTSDLSNEAQTFSKGLFHLVRESKDRFLENLDWSGLKVLETGSGRGGVGLHLAKLGAQVSLVDFSKTALEQAKRIYAHEGLEVKVFEGDVTLPDLDIKEKFDIIVDSHLLHCITEDPDRSSYYAFIKEHLTPQGIFVAESMVHRKKLFIPEGFVFDNRNILWQNIGDWAPIRRILDSLDLEAEIKQSGLEITYFYYYGQFGFVPHRSFLDIPVDILPASVRLVLKL